MSLIHVQAPRAAVVLSMLAGVAAAQPCVDGGAADQSFTVAAVNRIAPGVTVSDGVNQVATGDINNDGFDDIIVGFAEGAFGEVGAVTRRGVVRVFSGADGSLLREFTGATWANPTQLDGFGWRVGSADVNNDGFDDVLVGIRRFNNGAGRIAVFSGATGALLYNINGFGGDFGDRMVNLGDVTGDGRDDILASLPAYNPQGSPTPPGAVAVFSGANGALIDSTVGGGLNPRLGRVVGSLPDVNNDGVDEVFVATNQSMIVFSSDDLASGVWIRVVDQFGGGDLAAAAVGDVNNDGVGDLAVVRNGAYFVLSGVNGDVLVPEVEIYGAGAAGVARSFDDLDGDGVNDLVIAVRGVSADTEELLYLSAVSGDVIARRRSPLYFDPESDGSVVGYASGIAVGDINNDGALDVVLARSERQFDEAPFTESVSAYVYEGLPCVGDIDGDSQVNFTDLNAVLGAFGTSGLGIVGDGDCSGSVNFTDLNAVLGAFGTSCD